MAGARPSLLPARLWRNASSRYNARMRHTRTSFALAVLFCVAGVGLAVAQPPASPAQSAQPAKPAVAGVRNFTQVDATLACGGAVTPDVAANLKAAGFKSIVNLRAATEEGVNIEDQTKAAAAAGLKYYHLPFVNASPEATRLDEFLKLVVDPANQPMMLHCASGGRASMFWAVKRVMVDGWAVDKAMNELPDLSGHVSQPVKTFMLDYLKAHGK
jgi:uncharacterized protein (TIGR01244 family)